MRPYFLQPRSSWQSISPNYYNVSYRRSPTYKGMGMGQTVDITNIPTVGASSNPLFNLPLTGPLSAYGTFAGEAALQPGAASLVDPYVLASLPGGTGTVAPPSILGISGSMWPWIIGGGLVLVLLLGDRRR